MKKQFFLIRMVKWWKELYLADRLLLVFMMILLAQCGHNLFVNEMTGRDAEGVDVAIRTTAAGIFGYFISSGIQNIPDEAAQRTKNKIGFSIGKPKENMPTVRMEESNETLSGDTADPEILEMPTVQRPIRRIEQRMVIVAGIGIASLILLILVRRCGEAPEASTATLSQLRDFVSGSVGFLIGHGGVKTQIKG